MVDQRAEAFAAYQRKIAEHDELENRVRTLRDSAKQARVDLDITENHLKAL
jgi:hypothetical protein